MRMLLRPEFPNGQFGDPALYIRELNGPEALLVDCGDLTRFSTKQLLKVKYLFLSHCHVDHFIGFDLFLRLRIGTDLPTTIYGPPETSLRVGGKLQGYTWNLLDDQNLEFTVVELDPAERYKQVTRFHSRDRFRASRPESERWDISEPILDAGIFRVHGTALDHHTPSIAYVFEEKSAVSVNSEVIQELGLKPGPWIDRLKQLFLFGGLEDTRLEIPREGAAATGESFPASALASRILLPRQRHKIAYATDGAAHEENRRKLLPLIQGADLFYCETCFLERDRAAAEQTRHFTAGFMARLATEAQVRKLAPFHFSKRYLECPEAVIQEIENDFQGEILTLTPAEPYPRI